MDLDFSKRQITLVVAPVDMRSGFSKCKLTKHPKLQGKPCQNKAAFSRMPPCFLANRFVIPW